VERHTYMSHAIATAGALAVQKGPIENDDCSPPVSATGGATARRASTAPFQKDHPHVGDIRGRGLFSWSNRISSSQHAPTSPFTAPLTPSPSPHCAAAQARGNDGLPLARPAPMHKRGNHVLLAPAYTHPRKR